MRNLPDSQTVVDNLPALPTGVYPRLVIWNYAANLALEKPVAGHGLRSSRNLNKEAGKPFEVVMRMNGNVRSAMTEGIPLHPHNGILQLWLELGGIGAMIGLAIILSVLLGIHKLGAPPVTKALLYGALFSSIMLISVSYGLWQNWWLGLLWLQGSLLTASLHSQDAQEQSSQSF